MTERKHPGPQGPRRTQVAVRMSEEGIDKVDALAAEAGVTRSEMVRRLLVEAITARAVRKTKR